jgi:Ca-activated chloride channel homolog
MQCLLKKKRKTTTVPRKTDRRIAMTRRIRYPIAAAMGVLSLLAVVARAQQKRPQYEVDVETKMVRIYAMVFDKDGRIASGLTGNDFQVLDNGVPQQIVNFSNGLREPVSIVLDADVSQSMDHKLSFVREAVYDALAPFPDATEQAKFPDEFSLVRFAARAELVSGFKPPQKLQPGTNSFVQPTEGSTALFDSIYLAASELQREAANQRHAIILVTDGGDNHSRYSLGETRRFLEEEDVPIFPIMASPSMALLDLFSAPPETAKSHGPIKLPYELYGGDKDVIGPAERRGPHNLRVLAEATGGEIFTVNRLSELPDVVESIAVALRYSYLLGYQMPDTGAPHPKNWNGRHTISIKLVPSEKYAGYIVIAKSGYFEGYR